MHYWQSFSASEWSEAADEFVLPAQLIIKSRVRGLCSAVSMSKTITEKEVGSSISRTSARGDK